MDLFMIIYTAGTIGGVIGPLPYDMDQCIIHRDEARAQQIAGIAAGINIQTNEPLTADEIEGIKSLEFECEYHVDRPELGA